MKLPAPSHFHRDLAEGRLRVIAELLLDERYTTMREMTSPWDDNYTREVAVFGRQRNRLIDACLQQDHPWLTLGTPSMDLTFFIGSVPCRFFTEDNSEAPKKEGFFRRNLVDNLFAPDDSTPVMWRFIVERNPLEIIGDRVFFIGFNAYQEAVAFWEYRAGGPVLHSVDDVVPPAVEIPAPRIEPLNERPVAEQTKGSGTGGVGN